MANEWNRKEADEPLLDIDDKIYMDLDDILDAINLKAIPALGDKNYVEVNNAVADIQYMCGQLVDKLWQVMG